MVTAKDVVDLARGGEPLSARSLAARYGWTLEKSAKVLIELALLGVITPMDTSLFAEPSPGGKVPTFSESQVTDFRGKFYRDEIEELNKLFQGRDEGLTVTDLCKLQGISPKDPGAKGARNRLTKILGVMVERGQLVCRTSKYGGMMGRPPKIYGKTEDDIDFRELRIKDETEAKRKKP